MGSISKIKVLVPIIICLLLTSMVPTRTEAAVSCNTVVSSLASCRQYLFQGGSLTATCCSNIRMLNRQAKNTSDKRIACRCIKSVMGRFSSNPKSLKNAAALPGKCGVNLPFKIVPSTNCDSIK